MKLFLNCAAALKGGQDAENDTGLIPEDTTGFSATGLVMLGAGLARFNALQLMPTRWLQAYYDQLAKRADEFDQTGVVVVLESAAKSGINIPPRTMNMVVGQRLERIARAGKTCLPLQLIVGCTKSNTGYYQLHMGTL